MASTSLGESENITFRKVHLNSLSARPHACKNELYIRLINQLSPCAQSLSKHKPFGIN